MGRLDFYEEDLDDLKLWIARFVTAAEHYVIKTRDGEIVIKPRKSTRTYDYAWALLSPAKRDEIIKILERMDGMEFQGTGHFAWRLEDEPYRPGGLRRFISKLTK